MVKDTAFTAYTGIPGDYYLPTGNGSLSGNIDVAEGITESTVSADITTNLENIDGTIVLVGNDTSALPMTSTSATAVSQNIANEPASGDVTNTPRGLAIEGTFTFTGNNSHFTNESVTATDSTLTFAGEKSLFQSDMEFTDSMVTLSQASTFGKSLTVQGGSFVINAPLTFTAGSSFILKAPLEFVVGGGNYAKNNSFAYTLSSASYTISLSPDSCINILKSGSSISISSGSEFLDVLVDNTDFDTGKIRYKCISSLSDNTDFLFTDEGERTSFTAKEIWDLFEAIRTGTATYSGEVSTTV